MRTPLTMALALSALACRPQTEAIGILKTPPTDATATTDETTTSSWTYTTDTGSTDTTDTTTTTDTTDTTDTTGTTYPTSDPDPLGPTITALDLIENDLTLSLVFTVARGKAPIAGGTLLLDVDGEADALVVPDDLDDFDGETGTVVLDRPTIGDCGIGADHEIALELLDDAARSSGEWILMQQTADAGIIVDEIGDALTDLSDLGVLGSGDRICGHLQTVGNDGSDYTGDHDNLVLQVSATERLDLTLDWAQTADIDLYVYEGLPLVHATGTGSYTTLYTYLYSYYAGAELLGSAIWSGMSGPESLNLSLEQGVDYWIQVVGWDGAPGDWTLSID